MPAEERVKKSNGSHDDGRSTEEVVRWKAIIMLRHSRERGNPEAVVRNIGPVFLRKRRKEIPAFAGMTNVCKDGYHYSGRSAEGFDAAKDNNSTIMLRHSRERGNPEAAVRNTGPVFLRKRRKEIPAFAGMTSVCKDDSLYNGRSAEGFGAVKDNNSPVILRHSRERGNPEAAVRSIGPVLLWKRRKEIPAFAGMTR